MQEASGAKFIDLNWSVPFSAAVSGTNFGPHSFPPILSATFFSLAPVALMRSATFPPAEFSVRPCRRIDRQSGL